MGLKVGDEICFNESNFGRRYVVGTIKKITPTRQFVVLTEKGNEIRFNKEGKNGDGFYHVFIDEYNDDIKSQIKKDKLSSDVNGKITKLDTVEMSIENLEKLLAVLKEVQS